MRSIAIIALAGIVLLQFTGVIPLSSVGGPMMVALACFSAALAVGVHEAWTTRRGVFGWALNILIVLVATFFAAQAGGMLMVFVLAPFTDGSSLAAAGGIVMMLALIGAMGSTLLGSWGALQLLKRWR